MDTKEITQGLRGLVLAEPGLGFDPDDVADRGARRQRGRRVAALSSAAAAVAIAAVAFGVDLTHAGPTTAARPQVTTSTPPLHDLPAQAARNTQHLREVLGRVLPDAKDIRVTGFKQRLAGAGGGRWAAMSAMVIFRDDAGPGHFMVAIVGPDSGRGSGALCDPDAPASPKAPKLPNGRELRCKNVRQPDGSNVVVQETGVNSRVDHKKVAVFGLMATHDRIDGGMVEIVTDCFVSGLVPDEYNTEHIGVRSRNPLTEQQVIALATDPEFHLD